MPPELQPAAAAAVPRALPRVLLVEDDPSVRRLVALALDGQPIELLSCADGEEALALLRAGPVQVLVTDLMMPGISGLDLLRRLAREPALRQGAELVAFSAGIDAGMRQQLQALGVRRMLSKPVSLQSLEDVVMEAVASFAGHAPAGVEVADSRAAAAPALLLAPGGEPDIEPGPEPEPGHAAPADEARAIATHFGGDAALFHDFRRSCLPQFVVDLADGEAAFARADAAAVRRLGHSLKSVLATLGHAEASALARAMETAAAGGHLAAARAPWGALRARLQGLAAAAMD
ncbi:response regulator [Rubrivivax rivuli]|uniref:Response regulator n=1 Tax=Rubrivivax rivuli TaxID=1862385 RepID=A0A437RKI6_9BURK|nr:response regulator [Rubrivivax rivuli]RVU47300.1 response regulator [Rubrivivax rivuli]